MILSTIKCIQFHYENCEMFSVDADFILACDLSPIKMKYNTYAFPTERYKSVSHVHLKISSQANKVRALWLEEEAEPFERTVRYGDLVFLIIHYQNGTKEKVQLPWEGDQYINNNQTATIDSEGHLLLTIKK
jgi:hypothetical protein